MQTMENNLDIKQELQQDLRDLQQDIANHSTFNNDVWRRSVRRRVTGMYRLNLACSIFLIIFTIIITPFHTWPWWLVILVDLLIISITIYGLTVTRGMRRPDMNSKSGLLSLRESVQRSSNSPKRHKAIIYVVSGVLIVLLFIYEYKNNPDFLPSKLIGGAAGLLAGLLVALRLKKRYSNLSEEIDELLKEE